MNAEVRSLNFIPRALGSQWGFKQRRNMVEFVLQGDHLGKILSEAEGQD